MFLTLVYHHKSLKWLLPLTIAIGSVPPFIILWSILRITTFILPHDTYRQGDDFLYSLYQRQILFFIENLSGIKLYLYGDYEEVFMQKESALLISNHQSTADWLVSNMLAIRQGSLGNIRFIMKDGLKYFPIFGLYWKLHGFFYVKKQSTSTAIKKLSSFYSNLDMPSWIFIFPEGTRYNPENVELIGLSHKYAAEHDLPQLNHVLIPRVKGTYIALNSLKYKISSIYDITIAYSKTDHNSNTICKQVAPSLLDVMINDQAEIHVHINRIKINDLINEYKHDKNEFFLNKRECAQWLMNTFKRKDNMLNMFYSNNLSLDNKKQYLAELSLKETLPSFLLFTSLISILFATKTGRKLFFEIYLYGTLFSYLYIKFDDLILNKICIK